MKYAQLCSADLVWKGIHLTLENFDKCVIFRFHVEFSAVYRLFNILFWCHVWICNTYFFSIAGIRNWVYYFLFWTTWLHNPLHCSASFTQIIHFNLGQHSLRDQIHPLSVAMGIFFPVCEAFAIFCNLETKASSSSMLHWYRFKRPLVQLRFSRMGGSWFPKICTQAMDWCDSPFVDWRTLAVGHSIINWSCRW